MKMTERKKLLIYKIIIFVFAFIVAFMPATASRSREVNSRVIVEMLGVDSADGEVEVTAQYVMPSGEGGETSKDKLTVKGKNITQAVELISTSLGRRAELGHCSMVIIGDDVSLDALAMLLTATDITADVYLSAAEGKAKDVMGKLTDFMKKTGATDANFIAYGARKAHVATNTLLGFLSDLGSASATAFAPVVEMIEDGGGAGGAGGGQNSQGSQGSQGSQSAQSGESGSGGEEQSGMKVEKLALYGRGGRIGILDKQAARGVAWASASVGNGVVTADVMHGGQKECMSGRLVKKRASVRVDGENKQATVLIKATIEPDSNAFIEFEPDMDSDIENTIKSAFADAIKRELEAAFEEASELGGDPMFVLRQFYRFAPGSVAALGDARVSFDVHITLK